MSDDKQALSIATDALNLAPGGQPRADLLRLNAEVTIKLGGAEEAKPFLAEAWALDGTLRPELFVQLFAKTGDVARAQQLIHELPVGGANPGTLALGYLALGEVNDAFRMLETAIREQDRSVIIGLKLAESWGPMRDDPRFDDMIELLDSKTTYTDKYYKQIAGE